MIVNTNIYNNSERLPLKFKKTLKHKPGVKTHDEFMEAMTKLAGSIDDPTFVEPVEIEYESQREIIL